MSGSTVKILVAGAVIAAATIFATQEVLDLFPSGAEATEGSEQASFLAHLLLPLSVVLLIFVVITVVGLGIRLVRAVFGGDSGEPPEAP